jgi:hypothetical protein
LDWSEVTETFETSSIVVVDEAVEEGISLGMRDEEAMSGGALWLSTDGFDDATVEAFDQAVGLRSIGFGQAVVDVVFGADPIEGVAAGGSIARLVLHVDGEAVGELAAVVGQDGVQGVWEVGNEAAEECCGGVGIAPRLDLQIDVARGAVDGDEGVAPAPLQGGQVLEIDVNEADGRLLEDADRGLVGLRSPAQIMALETAVYRTAGELGVDTAPHHFGNVVERQLQLGSQFADQRLLERRQTGRQGLRRMRAVAHSRAFAPTADRRLADPELDRQLGDRLPAALNVSPNLRCGRGVGVQAQLHDARRSLTYEMPRSTPIPSNQSSGTKHDSGGGGPLELAQRANRGGGGA